MLKLGLLCIGLFLVLPARAQNRVDPTQMYHRVYARVPLIGSGSKDDPKRPMFAPLPSELAGNHTGVIAYQMRLSDDGQWALVEFVGASPKDLKHIVNSPDPNVKAFERGKSTKDEIETEFKKYKKTFTLDSFSVRAQ